MFSLSEVNGDLELEVTKVYPDLHLSIESILNTRKGEFFLDTEYGLDYSALEDKTSSNEDIDLSIREAIFQDERVTEIGDIIIDRDVVDRLAHIQVLNVNGVFDMEVEIDE